MSSIIDLYSKKALTEIVNNSFSYVDVARKIGFSGHPSSQTIIILKERLKFLGISVEHFRHIHSVKHRTPENTFVKNSTASQNTVRNLFKKGNYQEYVCSLCGLKPFWKGKELTLILDHIDGDNRNCVLSNLRWVCPNCNQQLETTGYKKMRAKPIDEAVKMAKRRPNKCKICGAPIYAKAKCCVACSHIDQYRTEHPTKEQLQEEIQKYSFVELGKKYGVTDNAVRKWCKSYGLPYKKSDINKTT